MSYVSRGMKFGSIAAGALMLFGLTTPSAIADPGRKTTTHTHGR